MCPGKPPVPSSFVIETQEQLLESLAARLGGNLLGNLGHAQRVPEPQQSINADATYSARQLPGGCRTHAQRRRSLRSRSGKGFGVGGHGEWKGLFPFWEGGGWPC